jgi:hypothetical protein
MEYRIEDCADCVHKHVCKFVGMLNDSELPIDFDTVTCNEYMPSVVLEDSVQALVEQAVFMDDKEVREYIKGKSYAELLEEFLGYISEGIKDCIKELGESPNVVEMCRETLELLKLLEGSIALIDGVELTVVVDEDIPFGQFEIGREQQ